MPSVNKQYLIFTQTLMALKQLQVTTLGITVYYRGDVYWYCAQDGLKGGYKILQRIRVFEGR
jgi:hypothetical protein